MTAPVGEFDLIVLGGGPAGISGAGTAAAFGRRVVLVEEQTEIGGAGLNSGTISHCSLPGARLSLECCTHTTGTSVARALSTTAPIFATIASRSYASLTTPFWTSITSSAVFGRFSSVVMALPGVSHGVVTLTLAGRTWAPRSTRGRETASLRYVA